MHVVAVTPLYPPESRVGAWLATHQCLLGLVAAGHTVEVVAFLCGGPEYEHDGIRVRNGVKWIREAVSTADLVVSHLGDNDAAHELAVRRGVPSVKMVHGLAPVNQLRKYKVHPVDLLVFNSRSSRAAAEWEGRAAVVTPPFRRADWETTPGECVTQVNVSDAKGGQLFGKLIRFMPDLRFLAVRGGYGQQQEPQGVNVKTIYPTKNMRDDVYSRTRVLVVPSRWETWGMCGVEAMCSGIPVVAAPTPGLRESLGDAGIFVETANFSGWLDAVRRLCDPSVWAEASARSLARVAELEKVDSVGVFVDALEGLV